MLILSIFNRGGILLNNAIFSNKVNLHFSVFFDIHLFIDFHFPAISLIGSIIDVYKRQGYWSAAI